MQIRESYDDLNFKMLCGMGPWVLYCVISHSVHEKDLSLNLVEGLNANYIKSKSRNISNGRRPITNESERPN